MSLETAITHVEQENTMGFTNEIDKELYDRTSEILKDLTDDIKKEHFNFNEIDNV